MTALDLERVVYDIELVGIGDSGMFGVYYRGTVVSVGRSSALGWFLIKNHKKLRRKPRGSRTDCTPCEDSSPRKGDTCALQLYSVLSIVIRLLFE